MERIRLTQYRNSTKYYWTCSLPNYAQLPQCGPDNIASEKAVSDRLLEKEKDAEQLSQLARQQLELSGQKYGE